MKRLQTVKAIAARSAIVSTNVAARQSSAGWTTAAGGWQRFAYALVVGTE